MIMHNSLLWQSLMFWHVMFGKALNSTAQARTKTHELATILMINVFLQLAVSAAHALRSKAVQFYFTTSKCRWGGAAGPLFGAWGRRIKRQWYGDIF